MNLRKYRYFFLIITLSFMIFGCETTSDPESKCKDIKCGEHFKCNDSNGKCECEENYTLEGDKCVKTSIDLCKNVKCGDNQVCNDSDGKCICKNGFILEDDKCVEAKSCDPNPCNETNKTVCKLKDGEVTCSCDENFSDYDGICCQSNSKNVAGKCECIDGYILKDGICKDMCDPNPCKETHKTVCKVSDNQTSCNCDPKFHDDNGICCQANAENKSGSCECKTGYIMVDDICVVDLCIDPNPCLGGEAHKTVCSMDNEGKQICNCETGFHLSNGKCVTNEGDPCHPNPCKDETTHKTKCTIDAQDHSKFSCGCNIEEGYHTDGDICCKSFQHNDGGVCVCDDLYIDDPANPGSCIIICTEDKVEGFNGYCSNTNEICVQGVCKDNRCIGFQCPANSKCSTQKDYPECYCNGEMHMDNNVCCQPNASNIGGVCKCDTGFELSGEECVPVAGNPCVANPYPCHEERYKNKCIVDQSTAGFHCECNVGYKLDPVDNKCKLIVAETCPTGLICLNDYCVEPGERKSEQCLTDNDCHEFNAQSNSMCNPDPVGGVCTNCQNSSDCPANTFCEETYHTCKNECDDNSDCPSGKCSVRHNICLIATCTTEEDCQHGSTCIKDSEHSSGMCKRVPCKETACSEFNQHGECESGKTCVYGHCIDSCSPNPCTNEPFKTVCSVNAGVVECECESGYHNENGTCVVDVVDKCPTGFVCDNGYCADKNDIGFVCSSNSDCGDKTTCSTPMTLPAGKCVGCTYRSDCPHVGNSNIFECIAGYCMATCSKQEECNAGMYCDIPGGGYCKKKECTKSSECGDGYVCNGTSLRCERIPCQ